MVLLAQRIFYFDFMENKMNKKYKFYFKIYNILLLILIIAFFVGIIFIFYLLKDIPMAIFFASIYIIIGLFNCVRNVRLLIDLRKTLYSKETIDDQALSKLKSEFKAIVLPFIVYLISIPFVIAVLLSHLAAT